MLNSFNYVLGRVSSQISNGVTFYILSVVLEYSVNVHFASFASCIMNDCVCE